jgi:hypothetical protein
LTTLHGLVPTLHELVENDGTNERALELSGDLIAEVSAARYERATAERDFLTSGMWAILNILASSMFFGVFLIRTNSPSLDITFCLLAVFLISSCSYVIAELDSPYRSYISNEALLYLANQILENLEQAKRDCDISTTVRDTALSTNFTSKPSAGSSFASLASIITNSKDILGAKRESHLPAYSLRSVASINERAQHKRRKSWAIKPLALKMAGDDNGGNGRSFRDVTKRARQQGDGAAEQGEQKSDSED